MSLDLGLSSANHKTYLATLAAPHDIKVTVQILTNTHALVSTVTAILLDGQVDAVNPAKDEVSRTCTLQFLDPKRTMTFDSDSPADGAVYLDRMVRVIYSVKCSFGWVDVPVFTGPVSKCDRDGDIVNVEAQGKESYGLGAAYHSATFKGQKDNAIRGLLTRMGEISKYWSIPDSTSKLAKHVTLGRESQIWVKAWDVAASQDRLLFYDARGIARSVTDSPKPTLTIVYGNGGLLMSDPQISFSTDELINAVYVKGGKTTGKKRHGKTKSHPATPARKAKGAPTYTAVAPRSHPLSPWKIGRNGQPKYLLEVEENGDFRTHASVVARAKSLLKKKLFQQIEATYTCLPIPHAEPWDVATVQTRIFNLSHRVNSFSLPLRHDALMTIGHTKNLAQPRRVVGKS